MATENSAAPRRVSWSMVSEVLTCAARYEFRFIKKIETPSSIEATIGRAAHAAIEANFLHRLEFGGDVLLRDRYAEIARSTVCKIVTEEAIEIPAGEEGDRKVARACDRAERLALLHYDSVAPRIIPVAVERRWEVNFPELGFVLTGRTDLETETAVRDTKTALWSPAPDAARRSDQLTIYAEAFRRQYGRLPTEVVLDYLTGDEAPRYFARRGTRSSRDIAVLGARILAGFRVIDSGIFAPAPRGSKSCNVSWCRYYSMCPYV